MLGKLILRKEVFCEYGNNRFELFFKDLPSAVYELRVKNNGIILNTAIIQQ